MSDDSWIPTESIGLASVGQPVRVKICGITTVHDAELACVAGADAIGLVFAESPRRITVEQAAHIVAQLPPFVTPVALFVNAASADIRKVCDQTGIRTIQLHGTERPSVLSELTGLNVIKAFRIADAATIAGVRQWLGRAPYWPSGLLFDAHSPRKMGGTGEVFDWTLVPPPRLRGDRPALILAGGLNSENVTMAILQTQPYAVDVASGVESSPGVKDANKLSEFITAAKSSRM